MADDFSRGSFIGIVKAWKPVTGLVGFALRPDVGVGFRVSHGWRSEVQSGVGLRGVLNDHGEGGSNRNRLFEQNLQ